MENSIKSDIAEICISAIKHLFKVEISHVEIQTTKEEFPGDYTLVVFPLLKQIKGKPAEIAEQIGAYLKENSEKIGAYNVVQGFLNFELNKEYLVYTFEKMFKIENYGQAAEKPKKFMVEFSSPNTNKPLHLGHLRNILLGNSVNNILQKAGYNTLTTQIINDRGIHICKSMLAWEKYGDGKTPSSTGKKGDHFVGDYYVKFDQELQKEIAQLEAQGLTKEEAKKQAPLNIEAQEMLQKWEKNDPATLKLWQQMNNWVYEGFNETYNRLGVHFDTVYYESNTYLLGKDIIAKGLESGVFYSKEDGSVWVDLTDDGLDEKLVLRSDGTSVYITQDLGTAVERFQTHAIDALIYTVGNEQDYHFKVLFLILKKLGYDWANELFHLSYGMVSLPDGKMKSREGTVVDADELLDQMHQNAKEITEELGKIDNFNSEEKEKLFEDIGQAALKYYILKVDPKKGILFDPKESIEFNGNTGPFIQYTFARIQSLLKKANIEYYKMEIEGISELHIQEKELVLHLNEYPEVIEKSANSYSPALVANYIYDLAKLYNSFYQELPILNASEENEKIFRLQLSNLTARTINDALNLLGINSPKSM